MKLKIDSLREKATKRIFGICVHACIEIWNKFEILHNTVNNKEENQQEIKIP